MYFTSTFSIRAVPFKQKKKSWSLLVYRSCKVLLSYDKSTVCQLSKKLDQKQLWYAKYKLQMNLW